MQRIQTFRCLLAWVLLYKAALAQNFLCADAELVQVAESARERSARFWTGRDLPGRWSSPCVIEFQITSQPGSGASRFQFANGEVFGWKMTLTGSRQSLIQDVIPHEVDHLVRASLVRRPILRWLDEGCASVFESPSIRQQLRERAALIDASSITSNWLLAQDYPAAPTESAAIYSVGHSLVEYLLTVASPQTLLELQRDSARLPETFLRHYSFPLGELPQRWDRWRQSSQPTASDAPSKPVLQVWTATWCGPCRQFKRDWVNFPHLRQALESHFTIQLLDFDSQPALARIQGVKQLPTFRTDHELLTGYTSAEDLLERLLPRAQPPPPPSASEPLQAVSLPAPATQQAVAIPDAPPQTSEQELPRTTSTPPADIPKSAASRPGLDRIGQLLPLTLTALQWAGLLGGTAMTGGLGGVALSVLLTWLRHRRQSGSSEGGAGPIVRTPFPRRLDEACQLLQLRQSEGRVAVLDALRGMFLDDELEKLSQVSDPGQQQLVRQIRETLDQRIEEVAPLTTKPI